MEKNALEKIVESFLKIVLKKWNRIHFNTKRL